MLVFNIALHISPFYIKNLFLNKIIILINKILILISLNKKIH